MKISQFCLRRQCGTYPTYSKRLTLATLMRIFRSFIPALAFLALYNSSCFAQNANTYDRRGIFAELDSDLANRSANCRIVLDFINPLDWDWDITLLME